jgi:hypothetical protein
MECKKCGAGYGVEWWASGKTGSDNELFCVNCGHQVATKKQLEKEEIERLAKLMPVAIKRGYCFKMDDGYLLFEDKEVSNFLRIEPYGAHDWNQASEAIEKAIEKDPSLEEYISEQD